MAQDKTLFQKLSEYGESDYYGFHMPGHKRQPGLLGDRIPVEIDITEIDGFDDLHHPEGILLEARKNAAKVFDADETHFLINGSTVGILSAIFSVTKPGDGILISRNCHKSVYHAIELGGVTPFYLFPEFDSEHGVNLKIRPDDVREILSKNPTIKAVVIVSPTYDGIVSDVKAIAHVAHEKEIPLIVDEAHGAHFGFHPYFPDNSNHKGADLVIQSLHKTLPSLTQTALLHVNGELVNRKQVRKYLGMFQSSSPSYILMSSIDNCIRLVQEKGTQMFEDYAVMLQDLRKDLRGLCHLCLVEVDGADPSKLIISTVKTNLTSKALYQCLLEKFHLQMEMRAGSYVLAMTSVADTKEGFERLYQALCYIDQNVDTVQELYGKSEEEEETHSAKLSSEELEKSVAFEDAVGKISLEYAYLYPPGAPIIVPGEVITKECVEKLVEYRSLDFSIEGLQMQGYILCE